MIRDAALAVISTLIGSGIGWGAQALTLAGRVDAVERQLGDIKADLRTLVINTSQDKENAKKAAP